MAYKVSVITPVYNAEATLPRAFESVRAQTLGFENIEYILVDDLSTDGSAALIDSYAAQYDNVKAIIRDQNSGAAGAPRNAALDIASAPYVMFLDDDDALFPDACRALYEAAERTRADIVSGLRGEDDESRRGREAARRLCAEGERLFGESELTRMSGDLFCVMASDFWCKLYRRDIIESASLRFPEGLMFEDVVFLFLYLSICKSGALITSEILDYTLEENSLSHTRGLFYYTTIPRAAMWGLERARELGVESRYAGYIEQLRCVEWYCECLCRDGGFSRGELEEIVAAWEPLLRYAGGNFTYDAPEAELITLALARGGVEAAVSELEGLREVYRKLEGERERVRRETREYYERQLEDIFSSNTWRLASAAQRLAFWKK